MRRDQLPPHRRPTYVLPQYRTAYVAVSKAACTSLKWLVADLMGEDPAAFRRASGRSVTRDMAIHQRRLWQRTPTLHGLSDEQLAEVDPDRGWFVFTVVRHPAARLFSAWQSKILLREPRWVEKVGDARWWPRIPQRTEDVVEDFRRFARAIERWPTGRVMRDRHFMPQVSITAPERMPYTAVYDTGRMPDLLRDLEAHLRAHGYDGEALRLRRSNETPLQPVAAAFAPEVQAVIATLYAGDYDAFGFEGLVPPKLHDGDAYPAEVFDEIARLVERHERIGDLAALVAELQGGDDDEDEEAHAEEPPRRGLAGRVRRRLLTAG